MDSLPWTHVIHGQWPTMSNLMSLGLAIQRSAPLTVWEIE